LKSLGLKGDKWIFQCELEIAIGGRIEFAVGGVADRLKE
jgi:hypothetical protein